ncbi:hypothetical protein [Mycolicibacterium sp. 050158]|jgi:hypothetical protein|uniref:hypothetical protein n=1 Tax=Mycolicibacterium sp. 050158 TaxID=3090602 RepID=UPI00299D358A|nr:hypothetical protein [Mycolicibacterium sp. 050158]MDX1890498.1 hypothetical protein [Mycolicibacterium sp. 050158]
MTATTSTNRSTSVANDGLLRFAMRLDAVLSGVMGVAGLALAPRMAELSGTTATVEYSLAVFLVAYGVVVYGLSSMRHLRMPGIAVVAGNVLYTVGAVAVVLAGVWPLTTFGVVLTLGSGVYTLVMADLQYLGLRRL